MLQVSWNNWNVFFCHGIWILIVIASLTWRRSTTICEVKYLMLLPSHTLTLVDTTSYKFKVKMIHIFKKFSKDSPSFTLSKNVRIEYSTVQKVSVFGIILVLIFPYSDWLRENTDRGNSECGHFSCSATVTQNLPKK